MSRLGTPARRVTAFALKRFCCYSAHPAAKARSGRPSYRGAAEFECVQEETPGAVPMGQLLARERAVGLQPDSYHARLIGVKNGTVEDDPKSPTHIGALAHTNNTGELTAVYEAVVSALARSAGAGSVIIWSDSLYAINMTPSKRRPKCTRNREIVARLRGVWRRLQRARPREVQLRHVWSHIKVPGNELADWLADNGRIFDTKGVTEATQWMRVWMTRPPRYRSA